MLSSLAKKECVAVGCGGHQPFFVLHVDRHARLWMLDLEAALQSNEEAREVDQAAAGLLRVDRRPVQPHGCGWGSGERELDEWSDADRAAVLRSDREPVEHLVLRGEVEPHPRTVSLEGRRIEFHDPEEGERFVPGPDRGLETGLELESDLFDTDREPELDPVRGCPGGPGVELRPALDHESEGRDPQAVLVEAMGQEDLRARDS